MAGIFDIKSQNTLDEINSALNSGQVDQATQTVAGVFDSLDGLYRTDGVSAIGLIGRGGRKEVPGFTPNSAYVPISKENNNDMWYGALLQAHPDFDGISAYYKYLKLPIYTDKSTADRFEQSKTYPNFKDDLPDPYQYYSTRDYYLLFNDASTDYFKHGLHVIYGKTPLRSEKNTREAWDGHEESIPTRLSNVLGDKGGTPYENNDPVLFGFEMIIDAVSSPLLNGSVEDFITQFNSISEVGSRKYVLSDFKQQLIKLFKTKGSVFNDTSAESQIKTSIKSAVTLDNSQSTVFEGGKLAYMSYYLKKISGLELLVEANLPAKKKYITDYRNDVIKITFTEDISSTMGTLAHLYKLLYWSKPLGKNVIPENLLRFNCDIVISEIRNLNRVRKAMDSGDFEVIKENVSRYIYSLKECQFWFDQPAHDHEIDISQTPKEFDQFVVTMDYKYVTSKFERWVPDERGFGNYAGYDNGALWKIGNPNSRGTQSTTNAGTVDDNSVPKFFTANVNSLKQNGVKAAIVLEDYARSEIDLISQDNSSTVPYNAGDESTGSGSGNRSKKSKSGFEIFKENSKKAAKNLAKNLEKAAAKELRAQVNIRLRLLNNSLDKIRNASGIGRMREPTNVYRSNYVNGISNDFFYDVRNDLRDFAGDAVGNALNGKLGQILRGGR